MIHQCSSIAIARQNSSVAARAIDSSEQRGERW